MHKLSAENILYFFFFSVEKTHARVYYTDVDRIVFCNVKLKTKGQV